MKPPRHGRIRIVNGVNNWLPAIIAGQDDFEIVGSARTPVDLLVEVKRTAADVVVLAMDDSTSSGLFTHLFAEFPGLVVLGVSRRHNYAFIEQLRPKRREIGPISDVQRVMNELRRAVQAPNEHPDGYAENNNSENFRH